jgi:hypothetical protein
MGTKIVRLSLFADNLILYLKDPKIPRHHKEFQQCSKIKNQLTNITSLSINQNEQIEKEERKTIPFTIALKKSNT